MKGFDGREFQLAVAIDIDRRYIADRPIHELGYRPLAARNLRRNNFERTPLRRDQAGHGAVFLEPAVTVVLGQSLAKHPHLKRADARIFAVQLARIGPVLLGFLCRRQRTTTK